MRVDGGDHVGAVLQHHEVQGEGAARRRQRQIRPLKGDARHFYLFTVQQFMSSRVASDAHLLSIKTLINRFHTKSLHVFDLYECMVLFNDKF